MDPGRKRRLRLVVSLCAVVVLATTLTFTTFSASSPARKPSQLAAQAVPGRSYELTGTVSSGSVRHANGLLAFRVRDRTGRTSVPVVYRGAIPDPFRDGREVIVKVRRRGGVFVGERDSLVTKCPSKFRAGKGS